MLPKFFSNPLPNLTKGNSAEFLLWEHQGPESVFSKTAEVFTRAYPSLR